MCPAVCTASIATARLRAMSRLWRIDQLGNFWRRWRVCDFHEGAVGVHVEASHEVSCEFSVGGVEVAEVPDD